jgi:hypothetical protein
MSSGLPSFPGEPRIVPFRPPAGALTRTGPPAPAASTPSPATVRRDAARHYLKFMLPSIPVTAFIATFVICYVVRAGAVDSERASDPTLPFLAALLLGTITGALCVVIYFGYVRISSGGVPHD